jgi:hypothetical protein
MIKNLISRWTMVKTTREGFYDSVAGKKIHYWKDCYSNQYMAASPWSYRIKLY